MSANFVYARGFNQLGTIDYNPIVPALGAGRRPAGRQRRRGHVGVDSAVHHVRRDLVQGLTVSLNKRFSERSPVPRQLHAVEGRGQLDRLPERVHPAAERPRPRTRTISTGCRSGSIPTASAVRRRRISGIASSLSGVYTAPAPCSCRRSSPSARAGRITILAGADLNGDGNGGAFPPDRARANPANEASSVGRNSGTMPGQATVDLRVSRRFQLGQPGLSEGIFEVFNLFNRTNYIETNNLSPAFIWGTGAYPTSPLPDLWPLHAGRSAAAGAARHKTRVLSTVAAGERPLRRGGGLHRGPSHRLGN